MVAEEEVHMIGLNICIVGQLVLRVEVPVEYEVFVVVLERLRLLPVADVVVGVVALEGHFIDDLVATSCLSCF